MNKVSIIGSGNVATHLAQGLFDSGITINQIFSRDIENAKSLAAKVNAEAINTLSVLDTEAIDILLISVKDDVIKEVSKKINSSNIVIAHTSGTIEMEALSNHQNFGVFYPLQTFSKNKEVDLSNIPFCIEGSDKNTKLALLNLANQLSKDVRFIDSITRKSIHLSAVFACNFSNHMLAIADLLLKESGQDLSVLKPLVQETISKAFDTSPNEGQTGPAARNDQEVMQNHVTQLANQPQLQDIYTTISESIKKFKNE